MAFTGIFCLSRYLPGISYHLRSSLIRGTATVILLSAAGLEKIFPSFVLSFCGYQPVDLSSCCSEQLHLQHQFIFMAASSSFWAFCRRVPASSTTASRQLRYTFSSKLTLQTTVSLRGDVENIGINDQYILYLLSQLLLSLFLDSMY